MLATSPDLNQGICDANQVGIVRTMVNWNARIAGNARPPGVEALERSWRNLIRIRRREIVRRQAQIGAPRQSFE